APEHDPHVRPFAWRQAAAESARRMTPMPRWLRLRFSVALSVTSLAFCAACAGGSSGTAANPAGLEQPRINVGIISGTATFVPLYLAVDDGLFAREGLQVELLPFRGGSDLIKAVVAGSADVGVVSLAEVASGIAAGQPLKAFYGGFNVPAFDWYAVPSI